MEFATDLSGGEDRYRPSFFELAAQEQLRDLLAPVVRYVLSVFAQRNPRYLLRIVNRHDEFFALVMFFVERHYLKTWGASFAENFYGLKRRKVLGTGSDRTKAAVVLTGRTDVLGKQEINSSLISLILIPYLRSKAQDYYEQLGGGVDSDLFRDSPTTSTTSQSLTKVPPLTKLFNSLKQLYKTLYPYVNISYEAYLLAYHLGYLFNKTPYWKPWLSYQKVEIRRMSPEDYQKASTSSPFSSISLSTITLKKLLKLSPLLLFEALKYALPTSIFFFRFLDWWYGPEGGGSRLRRGGGGGSSGSKEGGRALRAPSSTSTSISSILNKKIPKKGECCVPTHSNLINGNKGGIINRTVLSTGWVGCYKCLYTWVEEKEICPVEGTKVELSDLRKIVG